MTLRGVVLAVAVGAAFFAGYQRDITEDAAKAVFVQSEPAGIAATAAPRHVSVVPVRMPQNAAPAEQSASAPFADENPYSMSHTREYVNAQAQEWLGGAPRVEGEFGESIAESARTVRMLHYMSHVAAVEQHQSIGRPPAEQRIEEDQPPPAALSLPGAHDSEDPARALPPPYDRALNAILRSDRAPLTVQSVP